MSLKQFHVFFIVLSCVMALLLGLWGCSNFKQYGDGAAGALGVLGMVGALGLLGYLAWFVKKAQQWSYHS